jgi:hypothetical protein
MTKAKAMKTATRTTVTMLDDEATREKRGRTMWEIERGDRSVTILHMHDSNGMREALGQPRFVVCGTPAPQRNVFSADFSDALREAHAVLGGKS